MGWSTGRAWSREELRILEQNAGKVSVSGLALQLGRSKQSVQNCAIRQAFRYASEREMKTTHICVVNFTGRD